MSKTLTETKTRRKMALTMAAYCFVLALGAALPVVASYGEAITQRTTDGELEGGAFRPEVGAPAAGDEAERARRPRNTAEVIDPAELEISAPEMDDATLGCLANEDPRGS